MGKFKGNQAVAVAHPGRDGSPLTGAHRNGSPYPAEAHRDGSPAAAASSPAHNDGTGAAPSVSPNAAGIARTSLTSVSAVVALLALAVWVLLGLGNIPSPHSHLYDNSRPPWLPIFIGQQLLSSLFMGASRRVVSPVQVVFTDTLSYTVPVMLYSACKLDVATTLGDRGMNTSELAAALDANEDNTHRLMRALASFGYFQLEAGSQKWWNSALSSVMRRDHPNYACAFVGHMVEDAWTAWRHLPSVVADKSGTFDAFRQEMGMSIWDYYGTFKKQGKQFEKAMSSLDSLGEGETADIEIVIFMAKYTLSHINFAQSHISSFNPLPLPAHHHAGWYPVVHDFNWRQFKRVIDVGGSLGSMLARILTEHPHLKGVLFDMVSGQSVVV